MGSRFDIRVRSPDGREGELAVFDTQGRRVAVLLTGFPGPGEHRLSWSGAAERGAALRAGFYVLRLRMGPEQRSLRILLMR